MGGYVLGTQVVAFINELGITATGAGLPDIPIITPTKSLLIYPVFSVSAADPDQRHWFNSIRRSSPKISVIILIILCSTVSIEIVAGRHIQLSHVFISMGFIVALSLAHVEVVWLGRVRERVELIRLPQHAAHIVVGICRAEDGLIFRRADREIGVVEALPRREERSTLVHRGIARAGECSVDIDCLGYLKAVGAAVDGVL